MIMRTNDDDDDDEDEESEDIADLLQFFVHYVLWNTGYEMLGML